MKFHTVITLCYVAVIAAIFAVNASADALVITRAMKATTIAEVFVSEDSVRVELEIGVPDLKEFRNLLPDEIYERLGYDPAPLDERLARFLEEDLRITADGRRLRGQLRHMQGRYRIERDVITGEPLPAGDQRQQPVVFVVLGYALPPRARILSIEPPTDPATGVVLASIGFVAYHMGLPVNDFRYLGAEETLDLDWDDPWYSRFRNRNLRRQFDAPLSAFLYIENFEVRKEIIARPKDLQQWVDLGIAGRDTINAGEQEALKQRVATFFQGRNPVTIDGRPVEGTLDRIHFVRRSLRRTGVVDPPEDLPILSATLGIIFVYPIDSLPDAVTMSWEMFDDRINRVPASATDEAGGLPYTLQPNDSVLVWQNFLKNPTLPTLATIAPPSGPSLPAASAVGATLLVGVLLAAARRRQIRSRPTLVACGVFVVLIIAAWPVARVALPIPGLGGMSQEQTESVVGGLLTNVYRAFDYRDESDIYDTLARSASGDLLTQVYLETRQALELQNQGGARVKVKDVTLDSVDAEPIDGGRAFEARCTWTVSGSVGHCGHLHTRQNQYDALLTITAMDGAWKITSLELLEEQRVSLLTDNDLNLES